MVRDQQLLGQHLVWEVANQVQPALNGSRHRGNSELLHLAITPNPHTHSVPLIWFVARDHSSPGSLLVCPVWRAWSRPLRRLRLLCGSPHPGRRAEMECCSGFRQPGETSFPFSPSKESGLAVLLFRQPVVIGLTALQRAIHKDPCRHSQLFSHCASRRQAYQFQAVSCYQIRPVDCAVDITRPLFFLLPFAPNLASVHREKLKPSALGCGKLPGTAVQHLTSITERGAFYFILNCFSLFALFIENYQITDYVC